MDKTSIYRFQKDTIRRCRWEMVVFYSNGWKIISSHITDDGDTIAENFEPIDGPKYLDDNAKWLIEVYQSTADLKYLSNLFEQKA